MPHIHTEQNQHDMAVSAYIIWKSRGEWKCLVHMHRKIDRLMQIGGHIELTQTPWQAMAEELRDETGYELSQLTVLQPYDKVPFVTDAVVHPVPFLANTHNVGNQHYHSDTCYGFVAYAEPDGTPKNGESTDLRWLTLAELQAEAEHSIVLQDTADMYRFLIEHLGGYHQIPASSFSLDKPQKGTTYKR